MSTSTEEQTASRTDDDGPPPTAPRDDNRVAVRSVIRQARHTMNLLVALVALIGLYFGRELLVPIAIAVLFWFLINGVANGIAGPADARRFPIVLAKLIAIVFVSGVIFFSGQIVAENAAALGGDLNFEDSQILAQLRGWLESIGLPQLLDGEWLRGQLLLNQLPARAIDFIRGLASDITLIILYVMFLLIDERFFAAKLRALIKDDHRRRRFSNMLSDIAREARTYLRLMFFISLSVGLATYGFCSYFEVAGAAFWGFVAFILNFIPTIGSILAVLLPFLYALITLSDPLALLGLAACLAATQFVAGEIVLPRVMGDSLNLSSFVILVALVLWGLLWGPVGMFLAIPITVILVSVCAKFPGGRPIAVLLSKDGKLPDG